MRIIPRFNVNVYQINQINEDRQIIGTFPIDRINWGYNGEIASIALCVNTKSLLTTFIKGKDECTFENQTELLIAEII